MNKVIIAVTGLVAILGGAYGSYYAYDSYLSPHSHESVDTTKTSKAKTASGKTVVYIKPKTYVGTKAAITSYIGEVLTEKNGQIYSYREGIVESYLVDVGTYVKKGQVVARLLPAEYSADIANMIADRKSMRTEREGMVRSAELMLASAKERKKSILESIDQRIVSVLKEQDAKIEKLTADLANMDTSITVQEKTILNTKFKANASVTLETDKLSIRETTVKTAIKNAHTSLLQIFYGASSSLINPTQLKNVYLGAKNSTTLNDFTSSIGGFHAKYQNIDSMTTDETFAFARETLAIVDKALRVLDTTVTSTEYNEDMLTSDKQMLLETKTDEMTGILTILNEYEEQKSMLDREKSSATAETADVEYMLEKLKSERLVVEKELAMARAEKDRMFAGENAEKSMSLSEADRMIAEAEKMLIDARSSYKAAVDALAVLESAGFSNEVRAPFNGKISRRYINAGESISMTTPLYDIVGQEKIKPKVFVRFEVPETDLADLEVGKEVQFYRTIEPMRKLSAKISRISPAVGSQTKGIIVEAEMESLAKNIPIGSSVRVEMEKAGNMFMVPSSAVSQGDDTELSVFIIGADGIVYSKNISTERTVGLEVYVSSGLEKEDKIIASPKKYTFLEEGIQVIGTEKQSVTSQSSGNLSIPEGHKH